MDCSSCGGTMELDDRDPPTHGLCWPCASGRLEATLLQNQELQKEIERCREIAERDGKDYSILNGLKDQAVKELEQSNRLNDRLKKMLNEVRGIVWKESLKVDLHWTRRELASELLKIIEDTPSEKR